MAKKRFGTLLESRHGVSATWHGAAFVMEALLLLVFLAFALAVFMQLFGVAHSRGTEERQLTQAVLLASNDAEAFAAAPQAGTVATTFDAYAVEREVSTERSQGGTLYRAIITVTCEGRSVYELESARYVSDGTEGGDAL